MWLLKVVKLPSFQDVSKYLDKSLYDSWGNNNEYYYYTKSDNRKCLKNILPKSNKCVF